MDFFSVKEVGLTDRIVFDSGNDVLVVGAEGHLEGTGLPVGPLFTGVLLF